MSEWIETIDESIWLLPDETGEDDAAFISQALGAQPGDRVLDAPCGAGRIAVHLGKAGCRMTGIDRNPRFLARAQARFAAEGVAGEFLKTDIRKLPFEGAFDAVYNWGGSFGYFSDADNLLTLERLAAALRPGGRLLVDLINREFVLRNFRSELHMEGKTTQTRWENQRLVSTWFIADEPKPAGISSMRAYTPAQTRRLFEKVGLTWETAYGAKDGSLYRRGSRRLIVVVRKG
ncbi:MAG: SAM-dependent methyltransferase [Armatimonadota bacterium]